MRTFLVVDNDCMLAVHRGIKTRPAVGRGATSYIIPHTQTLAINVNVTHNKKMTKSDLWP